MLQVIGQFYLRQNMRKLNRSTFTISSWFKKGHTGSEPLIHLQVTSYHNIYESGWYLLILFTKQYTCKHSIILYSYHKKFLNNILGQRVVLSVRISDPATVLGLHLIEIANFKKPLRKLNRSRIPGIYLTLIDKFPDVSTFFY